MSEITGLYGSIKISEIKDIGDYISITVCDSHGKLVDLSTNKTLLEEWIKAFSTSRNTSIHLDEHVVVVVRHMRGNVLIQIFNRQTKNSRHDAVFNSDQAKVVAELLRGFLTPVVS